MSYTIEHLENIIEAALMAAGNPLTIADLQKLFDENNIPENTAIKSAIEASHQRYADTSLEIKEVASGFRFQIKNTYAPALSKLWEERPPRYSRAFLETLSLIAYRQPITRAEIEDVRGVAVSSHIIKILAEREWIRVIGHKDLPGKPALYGTTKLFLDYFNLKSLDELPTLAELKNLESQEAKLQQVQLELISEAELTAETEELDE